MPRLVLLLLTSLLLLLGAFASRLGQAFLPSATLNSGVAFGILLSQPLLIFLFLPTALLVLVFLTLKSKDGFWGLLFLTSGGLANFFERIIFGTVLDYIFLPPLPTFNLADGAIALGVVLLCLSFLRDAK